jgi:hypothetical protein
MATIVRNDRGRVICRIRQFAKWVEIQPSGRWSPGDAKRVGEALIRAGDQRTEVTTPEPPPVPVPIGAPPLRGPGSSREVWEAYAAAHGVEVTDDMSRGDILQAVRAA